MTYADYLSLTAAETTTANAPDTGASANLLVAALLRGGASRKDVEAWIRTPMVAIRNSTAEPGSFPLVIVAPGNDESAHDQAALAEFLASHGFVVATCPSSSRMGEPIRNESDVGPRAASAERDLAFLLDQEVGRLNVDGARIAAIGHSFGARAALLLAMARPNVISLVSLDGGIGTATGQQSFRGLPSYQPEALHASILHIYEMLDSWMAPDWTLLRALRNAPIWLAQTAAMHHQHFTSLGGLGDGFPRLLAATGGSPGTTAEFARVGEMVESFLSATVGSRTSGLARAGWPPDEASNMALVVRRLR